jgi:DNA polymerase-3 subunit beta
VDPVRFEQMVRMVAFASSTDESRPILGAVSFVFTSGGMEVAATDGFRLALFAQKKEASSTTSEEMTSDVAQTQVGATQKVLLPAKAITEVIKAMQKVKTDECVLQYSSRLKQLFFVTQSARMIVRQQEGNFPPYEKIVPDEVKTQIALERTVLERLVKAAIAFGRDGGGILQLELEYDVLHARSSSPTMGAFEESVPVELIKGGEEKQTIAFTAKYLQDFLSHVEDDVVWFGMNESLRPAVFSPAKLPELRYVVMPFRVQK